MKTHNMETKGTATAWIVGLFGAVISNLTSLTISEWSGIVSIVSMLIGLYLTWHYKRREDRRADLESKMRIKSYEKNLKNSK